jgi:hypothetical protein
LYPKPTVVVSVTQRNLVAFRIAQASKEQPMADPMAPGDRIEFSAITEREPLTLPGDARMIIWPVFALEVWDIGRAMARTVIPPPQAQPLLPDVPNWTWHEYGMRVGFWRLKSMLEALDVKPTVTLNARVCEDYPKVAVALPYNFEIHDIVMMAIQHQRSDAFKVRALDAFDTLYAESADSVRIMAVAMHPYLSGAAHRIRYVRETFEHILAQPGVVCWDGEQILDWYLQQRPLPN